MRTVIITDAWRPQVNGVVGTLEYLADELKIAGHVVELVTPAEHYTVPMPSYGEIRLSLTTSWAVGKRIRRFAPDHIHIATEGPLGIAARAACLREGWPFTTSYHTRFPEYLSARAPVPLQFSYAWLRRFHNAGNGCLVTAATMRAELTRRGFVNLIPWTRGVDRSQFHPRPQDNLAETLGLKRPIFTYVGRVAVEKNISAFLELDLPGTKVIVGDGPQRKALEARHRDAVFVGEKKGDELGRYYAMSDVFVFPSRTDTYGNVLLEALACGVPVAAYPVPGPLDVIHGSRAGVLHEDLRTAALLALAVPREAALAHANRFSWAECARIFIDAGLGAQITTKVA